MPEQGAGTRERILEVAERLVFERGFNGTSLNDIMTAADLTKGAFFHHFKDKAELAHALVERWARNDYDLFKEFAARAEALADDPLQEALLFLKLFEEWVEGLDGPPGGCMFASYTYESQLFDDSIHKFIVDGLEEWMALFEEKFDKVLKTREPTIEGPSARDLTELVAAAVEGGFILSRAFDDRLYLVRQLSQIRSYLKLLFDR